MDYRVLLMKSDEGYALFCPALPGCYAQGKTETEALEEFREVAPLWLECGGIPAADGGRDEEAELLREAAEDGIAVTVHEVGLPVAA